MESEGQDGVRTTQDVAVLAETSPDRPHTTQPESQRKQEEAPIHITHNERSEAQPEMQKESESSEFEFQDAHLPLAVLSLVEYSSGRIFNG